MARSVFIAIPAYTDQVYFDTMASIVVDAVRLDRRGDKLLIGRENKNPNLSDARAILLARFLDSDATDLIFMDYDMSPEHGATLRLLDAPADFVGAVGTLKKRPIKY